MNKPTQILVLSIIFIGICIFCLQWIGSEQYKVEYCKTKINSTGEKGQWALMKDQVWKSYPPTGEIKYGCCYIPEGMTRVSKSKYCIYVKDYSEPTFIQSIKNIEKV